MPPTWPPSPFSTTRSDTTLRSTNLAGDVNGHGQALNDLAKIVPFGACIGYTPWNPAYTAVSPPPYSFATSSATAVPIYTDAGLTVPISVTFTVPQTGAVIVHLSCVTAMGAGNTWNWCMMTDATHYVPGTMTVAGASATRLRTACKIPVSGLTPGATLTWWWGVCTQGSTLTHYWGYKNSADDSITPGDIFASGAALFEVYAA